ncbi:Ras-like protein [Globisporangium polare]
MEIPSVRVLVVGDSGVGKTTLLHAVCRHPSAARDAGAVQSHRWTTGCDVHVLYFAYREGYGAEKEVYVEFIDVGGHPKYEISRAMFYHDVQGVIFMHDLSNARSYDHLKAWNCELALYQRTKGCVMPSLSAARPGEYPTLNALPKLIIGNKRDTIKPQAKRPSVLPELRNIDATESSAEPYALDPTAFHGFLDRVIAFANSSSTTSGFGDSASDYNTNVGFMSPFAQGLRQMKSKPNNNNGSGLSPSSNAAPLSGSGPGSARGWWK